MTLQEYLIEHLSNSFYPIITEDNNIFDYTQIKLDLLQLEEPAKSFFKNVNIANDGFFGELLPWTEWGWKEFMGKDGTGKGGVCYKSLGHYTKVLDVFDRLLSENGLDKTQLISPENKEEKSEDDKSSKEKENDQNESDKQSKEESEPKGKPIKESELDTEKKNAIAIMMLDDKMPLVKIVEKEKVYYLDENDQQDIKDDTMKSLIKSRFIYAALAKYLYIICKEISTDKSIQDVIKGMSGGESGMTGIYLLFLLMILKYDFETVGNFSAFGEGDAINEIAGDEVDDSVIRDFYVIGVAINTLLNTGLDTTQISQLINLTGLLNENA